MGGGFHTGYRKQTVFPLAARTTTQTSNDLHFRGDYLRLRINVTAITDTPSLVMKVQRKNPDGTYTDILADAAVTAVGESILDIGPGLTAAANVAANAIIRGPGRVVVTAGDADPATYSVTMETF